MSLRSEMILDAKLVMRDGLTRTNPAAEIDARGYVADWHSNLLPGIDAKLIEADFRAGKGSELVRWFRLFGQFGGEVKLIPVCFKPPV